MDMAAGSIKAIEERVAHAEIVFDRFHVQHLVSGAVDEVRCEHLRDLRGTLEGKALFRCRVALPEEPVEAQRHGPRRTPRIRPVAASRAAARDGLRCN